MASLWPAVVALAAVILLRHAAAGLLAGGFAGALLAAAGNPGDAIKTFLADHLIGSLTGTWHVAAILFTLLLGTFAGVLESGGGFAALVHPGKTPPSSVRLPAESARSTTSSPNSPTPCSAPASPPPPSSPAGPSVRRWSRSPPEPSCWCCSSSSSPAHGGAHRDLPLLTRPCCHSPSVPPCSWLSSLRDSADHTRLPHPDLFTNSGKVNHKEIEIVCAG